MMLYAVCSCCMSSRYVALVHITHNIVPPSTLLLSGALYTNEKTPNLRASYYAEEGNSVPVSIGINHPVGINHCMKVCLEASKTNEYCLCHCTPNCASSDTQRRTGQGHEETGGPKSSTSQTQRQPDRACVVNCVDTHRNEGEASIQACIHQCPSILSII